MRKVSMAIASAIALFCLPGVGNAAPAVNMDVKAGVTLDGTQAQQVHWKRWRHCHRACTRRHHHRVCRTVCHGGRHGHH